MHHDSSLTPKTNVTDGADSHGACLQRLKMQKLKYAQQLKDMLARYNIVKNPTCSTKSPKVISLHDRIS
jgi:hypothetical protein